MKNQTKQQTGKKGEQIATEYLKKQGYKILERNYYTNRGELDIIAKQKKEIIFIEVKTRKNNKYGLPREAVTKNKQQHMYTTARLYLYKTHQENAQTRFDVIEVYITKNKTILNHIKQII